VIVTCFVTPARRREQNAIDKFGYGIDKLKFQEQFLVSDFETLPSILFRNFIAPLI